MDLIKLRKLNSNYQSQVYHSGQWVDGLKMRQLEEQLQKYLNIPYVILTNSGTSALFAAYWALRHKHQAVTTDPYTFPATYQPAKILNYQVNFTRWTLLKEFEAPGNLRTVTHLFGQTSTALSKLLDQDLIEDAAQSFGAEYQNKKLGTLGLIGIYSFYPTKTLHTCGHGGAIVTRDSNLYEEMKTFVECGRHQGIMTEVPALNLRLDEIKAEYLIQELSEYPQRMAIQREIAHSFLEVIPGDQPFLKEDLTCGERHLYSVFNLLVENRQEFQNKMSDAGIETVIYYDDTMLPKTERHKYLDITSKVVAIPCRWNLTAKEVRHIRETLKGAL